MHCSEAPCLPSKQLAALQLEDDAPLVVICFVVGQGRYHGRLMVLLVHSIIPCGLPLLEVPSWIVRFENRLSGTKEVSGWIAMVTGLLVAWTVMREDLSPMERALVQMGLWLDPARARKVAQTIVDDAPPTVAWDCELAMVVLLG
mmetsp:Transcript_83640/g.210816  ORF Transcript_83640/g.210816 Transcript_83640/m.210816 type:complete len:145 (-) Transcript_83640:1087-1521(-)